MVSQPNLKPKTVLGVAAHPDDLDFGAGGTFAKWAKEGADIYYLILTDGSKGTSDRQITPSELVKIRRKEQQAAAKKLGVKDVTFLSYEDGQLECNMEVKKDIASAIRKVKPDLVVTLDPTFVYSAEQGHINHTDHRAAGQAALGAVYPLARDHLSLPELAAAGLEPHITPTLLLINPEKQNWYEDVSDTIDIKLQALAAHASQGFSSPDAQKNIRFIAEAAGNKHGSRCAEGFVRIDIK